jgi:hypothetical protein
VSDKERLARLALEYMWSVFESTAPLGYEEVTNGLADRILAAGWRPAQPSQAHQAVVTEAARQMILAIEHSCGEGGVPPWLREEFLVLTAALSAQQGEGEG